MPKIAVMSDLHLEFSEFSPKNTQNADVLVLSGDILTADSLRESDTHNIKKRYRQFLQRASREFAHVVYIAGNHEFYYGDWNTSVELLRAISGEYGIHFLECESVELDLNGDSVLFIGATLWTDMNNDDSLTVNAAQHSMNDYACIRYREQQPSPYDRRLLPHDTIARHRMSVAYIKDTLDAVRQSQRSQRVVVVGHHGPSFQSVDPNHKHDVLMNGAYCSELSEFILEYPEIVLWTAGHTHHAYQYYIGTTRVVCNPRGYHSVDYNEQTGWDPNLVIDI